MIGPDVKLELSRSSLSSIFCSLSALTEYIQITGGIHVLNGGLGLG